MSTQNSFITLRLDLDGDGWFDRLVASADFQDVTGGRVGNHLTRPDPRGVPIVRTTTRYQRPPVAFSQIHDDIVSKIKSAAAPHDGFELSDEPFNHALIEVYDQSYTKMGYHSDQSIDLDERSYIAVFSCYDRVPQNPKRGVRQLIVKSKDTGERFSVPLEHGSAVLFSVATNARYSHKIVLSSPAPEPTRWLGLTLRCSRTFIQYSNGEAHLDDGTPLTLADAAQRKEFYRLRGQENRSTAFRYPRLDYTISAGDLMPPIPR